MLHQVVRNQVRRHVTPRERGTPEFPLSDVPMQQTVDFAAINQYRGRPDTCIQSERCTDGSPTDGAQ